MIKKSEKVADIFGKLSEPKDEFIVMTCGFVHSFTVILHIFTISLLSSLCSSFIFGNHYFSQGQPQDILIHEILS